MDEQETYKTSDDHSLKESHEIDSGKTSMDDYQQSCNESIALDSEKSRLTGEAQGSEEMSYGESSILIGEQCIREFDESNAPSSANKQAVG